MDVAKKGIRAADSLLLGLEQPFFRAFWKMPKRLTVNNHGAIVEGNPITLHTPQSGFRPGLLKPVGAFCRIEFRQMSGISRTDGL